MNSSCGKAMNDRFKCTKCTSRGVAYVSYDNDYNICDDSTKIKQHKWKNFNNSLWYRAGCGQKWNFYKDSKSANLHKREYHKLKMK